MTSAHREKQKEVSASKTCGADGQVHSKVRGYPMYRPNPPPQMKESRLSMTGKLNLELFCYSRSQRCFFRSSDTTGATHPRNEVMTSLPSTLSKLLSADLRQGYVSSE